MDFGSITTTSLKAGSTQATIQMQTDSYGWKASLDGIQIGESENSAFGLKDASVTIDTGRQCIYVPEDTYEWVHS